MKRQIILQGGAAAAVLTVCLAGTSNAVDSQPAASNKSAQAVNAKAAKPAWNYFHEPRHVRSAKGKCGKKAIAEASGRGRMMLRIDETKSASSTFSKSFSINYKAFTAEVGWDLEKSRSITVSGSKEVPRGKYGVLKAYTRYSAKKFDVYHFAKQKIVARGVKAYKPIGVCYKYKQK